MTTNLQYHWKEYKRKDYGPIKDYKITHKPKYHEYKKHHGYEKIKKYEKVREYQHKEYKPTRPGYHGYRPEARPPRPKKEKLLPKRPQGYPMHRFRQIKHCYKLPMGPEYPVKKYKIREYKRKKEQLDYHEYNSYKPFKRYPFYNGSVHYKLTPLNFYGFRRGRRVYRPITPANPGVYPLPPAEEQELPQQTLTKPADPPRPQPLVYKPLPPAKETVYPQQILIMPTPKEKEVYQPIVRDDNGFYRLKHPVGYHEYNSKYRPYKYKEYERAKHYNHLFTYTAKDMPDHKPHIVRTEKEIRHISYAAEQPKEAPVAREQYVAAQKPTKKWVPPYAKEEKLKQQILIMPKSKPEKVQVAKRLPNQTEPEYPSQILILPKVEQKEEIRESVVKQQQPAMVPKPRYVPLTMNLLEESETLTMPLAPKKPRYVPNTKALEEKSEILILPQKIKQSTEPVETQKVSEVVKPVVVPLVAAAPPPKPNPRYIPTTKLYSEESVIVTIPKKARIQPEKPKPEPPQVSTVTKEIQTQTQSVESTSYKANPVVVPVVAVAAKTNKVQNSPPEVAVTSKKDSVQNIPPEVSVTSKKNKAPVVVGVSKTTTVVENSPPKPNTPPLPQPQTTSSRVETNHDKKKETPVIIPVKVESKKTSKPKTVSAPKQEPPTPVKVETEPKEEPEVPVKKPDPPKAKPTPKPDVGPIATIPQYKPKPAEPEPEKPKYTPLPVKPPQPRQNFPKQKPIPKPEPAPKAVVVEPDRTPPEKEVKPEPPPKQEPEPTPRTPPKMRTAIRKPSIPRAPSPPLQIPPPPPPKAPPKKPVEVEAPSLDLQKLGALGSVKRTIHMMG